MTDRHESLRCLDLLVDEGWLRRNEHGPLVSYNYAEQCVYAAHWTPDTERSRGTIYEAVTGRVVARAFSKFFNVGERDHVRLDQLPIGEPHRVYEKIDGALGIIYRHADVDDGAWRVATRGRVGSTDMTDRATMMLRRLYLGALPEAATPLVEIVYPYISGPCISYGEREELVLLAVLDKETGADWPREHVDDLARTAGFARPRLHAIGCSQAVEFARSIPWTEEGWVVHWPDRGLRVKIKGAAYMFVAKARANMTPLFAWEAVCTSMADQFVQMMPDELQAEARALVQRVEEGLASGLARAQRLADHVGAAQVDLADSCAVGDAARRIVQSGEAPEIKAAVFSIMRRRTEGRQHPVAIILKALRPTSNEWQKES